MKIINTISHDCFHYLITVTMISKFEKSELSILLANRMDNMDRTWKWFINLFFRMCNKKVMGHVNGKFGIVMRISCKVVYYLVIAIIAYITTRDQGDYFAESDLSNMETHVTPSFRYKLVWAFVVFGILVM